MIEGRCFRVQYSKVMANALPFFPLASNIYRPYQLVFVFNYDKKPCTRDELQPVLRVHDD